MFQDKDKQKIEDSQKSRESKLGVCEFLRDGRKKVLSKKNT